MQGWILSIFLKLEKNERGIPQLFRYRKAVLILQDQSFEFLISAPKICLNVFWHAEQILIT